MEPKKCCFFSQARKLISWIQFKDSLDVLERLCPEHWLWLMTLDLVIFCTVLKRGWAFDSGYIYSKTCLKWNLKGPEHFSAKTRFLFNQGTLHIKIKN
jgi:hypothetical protein